MSNVPIFRPSFGNRPDRIVGREDVLQAYANGLASYTGSRDRSVLITGQRGMGKTALLLEMADAAAEAGFVPARVTCGPTMLDDIIDTLQRKGAPFVKDRKTPIKGFSAGALGFSFGLTFTDEARNSYGFRAKLEMICERLGDAGKGVALLVDEVQPASEPIRQLATTYQELVGDEVNIAIVMAGLPAVISEVLEEDTLTFLNRARKIDLGPIPTPAVRAYYATAFKRIGRDIDDPTLDRAAEAVEGFPYLLQLLGYYLVEYTSEGDRISEPILSRALDAAVTELDANVFGAMLRPLSRADMDFLRAMSIDSGEPTHVGDLEERLGVSQGHVQSYRRRLIDAGLITSPRRGELAFVIPQLGTYLQRSSER
ncbi:MAG: hypothetical protein IJ087_20910 [Eggerthellaceae bacterium]|nr:hypothetical protein [Eggerthellaceae bacterium]